MYNPTAELTSTISTDGGKGVHPRVTGRSEPGPNSEVSEGPTVRNARRAECRDRQLWTLAVLTLIGIGAGFAVLSTAAPGLGANRSSLPQLTFGFAALVTCLNIYLGQERRTVRAIRAEVLEQFIRAEKALAHSLIDPLTGLFNRRYFDYLAVREAKRADRGDGVFSVVIVDVDNLKTINDRFGHAEGDRVLQQVADLLKTTFRQTDTIARYGGDEFLILMPATRHSNSHAAMDRLLGAVDAFNRTDPAPRFPLSLSWGTAGYEALGTVDEVVASADRRMYEHKNRRLAAV